MNPLSELKSRLLEVDDLNSANSLLRWDQMTYMPPAGNAARARQTATLSRVAHEKFTDVAVGRLLDQGLPTTPACGRPWAPRSDTPSVRASAEAPTR